MGEWNKTSWVLCAQNCGLEVRVENNRMVKVRPDKDNPRRVCLPGLGKRADNQNPISGPLTQAGE